LQADLLPEGEALALLAHDLDVVVGKADTAERKRGEHHNPYKGVGEIGPEQRGNQDRDADKHATHGGRAPLLEVGLRAVVAHILTDLELAQLVNHIGADQHTDEQRRETGKDRAKGQIPEDPEDPEVWKQLLIEQPIEQSASAF
jgi:hypothetical protein